MESTEGKQKDARHGNLELHRKRGKKHTLEQKARADVAGLPQIHGLWRLEMSKAGIPGGLMAKGEVAVSDCWG